MKVVYLPTDDRPYCYAVVCRFSPLVPLEVRIPPRELLGNRWRGADLQQLTSWLWGAVAGGDTLVLSLDALLYGGLVQGREAVDSSERVDAVCKLLRELRQRIGPTGKLYLFYVWKRLWGNISSLDEISKMDAVEQISSRLEKEMIGRGTTLPVFLRMIRRGARVPAELDKEEVARFATHRSFQRKDFLAVLDLKPEVLDHVHLAREDNCGRGLYPLEVESLVAEAKQRRVPISSAEGGDEAGIVLLAGRIAQLAASSRFVITLDISAEDNLSIRPAYEGRPFGETLKELRHLTLGEARASTSRESHLYLSIDFSGEIQKRDRLLAIAAGESPSPPPPGTFLQGVVPAKSISRKHLRVDLSYVNGVNEELVHWFAVSDELPLLVFQGGTAANRTGCGFFAATALKYALEHRVPEPEAWQRIAEAAVATYLEEVLYNGYLRTWAISRWGGLEPPDEATLGVAEKELTEAALAIAQRKFNNLLFFEHPLKLESVQLRLPWKRWFECEVDVKVKSP